MNTKLKTLGIIPDGNRRWATQNGLSAIEGHHRGADVLHECLEFFRMKGVSEIIVYALSEDNLNRPAEELRGLFKLYEAEVRRFLNDKNVHENEIRIEFLSTNPSILPQSLRDVISELKDATKDYSKHVVRILLSWSAKQEVAKVAYKAYELARKGLPLPDISKLLMVKSFPDLIIRTGNQSRMSDFLTLQAGYSEMYFTDKMFPEMTKQDFEAAYDWFLEQKKNIGR